MHLSVQGNFFPNILNQPVSKPVKTAILAFKPWRKGRNIKRAKALSPCLTQRRSINPPLQQKPTSVPKCKSFSAYSPLLDDVTQICTKDSKLTLGTEQLKHTQHLSQALSQLLSETENIQRINPLSLAKTLTAISESLTTSMAIWSNYPHDFLTRHLLDYNVSLCVKLNHRLERQAKLQDSNILLNLSHNLDTLQQQWRQTRYSRNLTLQHLDDWLQQSACISRKRTKRALRPLVTHTISKTTNPSTCKSANFVQKTPLGHLIDTKQTLGEYLLMGNNRFVKQRGQEALNQLHLELNQLDIQTIPQQQRFSCQYEGTINLSLTERHLGSHTEFLFSKLLSLGSKNFCEQFHHPYGSNNNGVDNKILHYLASEVSRLFPEQLQVNHYNIIRQAKPNDPKLKALIDSLRFVSQHPTYQQVQHQIDSLTLSRGLPPVFRGNAESLIQQGVTAVTAITNNRQSALSIKWKKLLAFVGNKTGSDTDTLDMLAKMPSQRYHRRQKIRHLLDKAHSVHNHRLMRDIQQQHRTDHAADLVKEKAKLGRGLQPNQDNSATDTAQEPGLKHLNLSITPEAFGFTEAVAGLRSCVHKIKKNRSHLKELKQKKSGRQQARQALQTFSKRPLTEQIEQLPNFYNNLLNAHQGKLDPKGLYNMAVDVCDAWLGATRYSANIGTNAVRIGSHLTEAATGTPFISSGSQALTAASTASSILACGLSTAKASKNALALKHQCQTLTHYKQEQQQALSTSKLAPLLSYAIQKQHRLTPKVVDLLKEVLSASAYGISSGVGITSIATTGTTIGLSVAAGVGTGAAAVAAASALGTVAYHHGRLYKKNQRLEQAAQQWHSNPLACHQNNPLYTNEQSALLKRLPNAIADLLVQDLKREISTDILNQVRGEFLALFNDFPKERPVNASSKDAKMQVRTWIERIKAADPSLLKQLQPSASAQCLRQIGMEPSVIFGIALSTDSEEQDELSRQLILQYAGIHIVKGKALRFEDLDSDLNCD